MTESPPQQEYMVHWVHRQAFPRAPIIMLIPDITAHARDLIENATEAPSLPASVVFVVGVFFVYLLVCLFVINWSYCSIY